MNVKKHRFTYHVGIDGKSFYAYATSQKTVREKIGYLVDNAKSNKSAC